ncbi:MULTISPECIES: hypothetical protein [Streptomyces]|nr:MULTISPECIES: hypothetical protein [unclassified Streptomyces]WSD94129.1 hypothetical protein OG758_07995 [Streptomyces sp. NBC_01474]
MRRPKGATGVVVPSASAARSGVVPAARRPLTCASGWSGAGVHPASACSP